VASYDDGFSNVTHSPFYSAYDLLLVRSNKPITTIRTKPMQLKTKLRKSTHEGVVDASAIGGGRGTQERRPCSKSMLNAHCINFRNCSVRQSDCELRHILGHLSIFRIGISEYTNGMIIAALRNQVAMRLVPCERQIGSNH